MNSPAEWQNDSHPCEYKNRVWHYYSQYSNSKPVPNLHGAIWGLSPNLHMRPALYFHIDMPSISMYIYTHISQIYTRYYSINNRKGSNYGQFSSKSHGNKWRDQQFRMGLVRYLHAPWYRSHLYSHHQGIPDFTHQALVDKHHRIDSPQVHKAQQG